MSLLTLCVFYRNYELIKTLVELGATDKTKDFLGNDTHFYANCLNDPDALAILKDKRVQYEAGYVFSRKGSEETRAMVRAVEFSRRSGAPINLIDLLNMKPCTELFLEYLLDDPSLGSVPCVEALRLFAKLRFHK
jgi:hypothetical protein